MTADLRLSLLAAATPAITGSVLLMQYAGVGRQPILQQLAVFGAGCVALAFAPRYRRAPGGDARLCVMPLALVVVLVLPVLLGAGDGPQRWMHAAGVRLYLAPVVLPVLLLLLARSAANSRRHAACAAGAAILAGLALLLQPDAAQLGALACAAAPILCTSRLSRTTGTLVLAALAGGVAIAWQHPDPLTPVAHVEGVFALARQVGPLALAAALAAALAPVVMLLWLAWRARSTGVLGVAVYYGVLLAHAPLSVTPVPLLGFGAGPIVGYCLMAVVATRRVG